MILVAGGLDVNEYGSSPRIWGLPVSRRLSVTDCDFAAADFREAKIIRLNTENYPLVITSVSGLPHRPRQIIKNRHHRIQSTGVPSFTACGTEADDAELAAFHRQPLVQTDGDAHQAARQKRDVIHFDRYTTVRCARDFVPKRIGKARRFTKYLARWMEPDNEPAFEAAEGSPPIIRQMSCAFDHRVASCHYSVVNIQLRHRR